MKYLASALLLSTAKADLSDRDAGWWSRLFENMHWGPCGWIDPAVKPDPVGNFDTERYKGTWFEIERSSEIFFSEVGETECTTATYEINPWNIFYPVGVNNRAKKMSDGTLGNTVLFN